jgi:sugar (glycoside-pentoside-hexuronide) transporter
MSMKNAPLTTRLSYASTEVGGQLIFCVISFYLLKFYTDVYGISAAAAGSILLLARCVDAVDAPVWGIIFDKTRSRWGKSRPWFLWLCVPFAISGVLTFSTFHLGHSEKIIYAICTYVACSVLYTGINTPVTSILASLTRDDHERVTLTSFRMFGSKFGVLFVNLTLIALVAYFGSGNSRKGFMTVMPIYAAASILIFLFAFRHLEEKVPDDHRRLAVRESVAALRGNVPWLIVFVNGLFFWIAFTARIATAPYYFQYVLHRPRLVSIADSLDVVSLGTILFLPYFCRIASKRNVWILGLLGSIAGQVVLWFGTTSYSLGVVMTGWTIGFLASGIAMAIPFSVISNTVDFGEWKTGIRAAGFLTAIGSAFCLKAGSGLGGALPAWIMSHYSYIPNVEQSARSLFGINFSFIWLPAIAYAAAILPLLWYLRYERMEPRINSELEQRRRLAPR